MSILSYGEIDLDIYLKLDRLPTMERSADCKDEFENVGGAAANSALWLANWGVPTRLAGHDLGDDRAGDAVRRVFAEHPELDTSHVACHSGYRTPRCQCLVTPDGERSFITHWMDEVRITWPSADMMADIQLLNLDKSGPLPPRLHAAQLAKERGIPILINDIYEVDNPILALVDVLVISAAIIHSRHRHTDPLGLAVELQSAGDCHVIITNSSGDLTVLAQGGERETITAARRPRAGHNRRRRHLQVRCALWAVARPACVRSRPLGRCGRQLDVPVRRHDEDARSAQRRRSAASHDGLETAWFERYTT